MTRNLFSRYASDENNPDWENHIERETQLYHRKSDIRSEYERDYTRILHSLAYRRLKHIRSSVRQKRNPKEIGISSVRGGSIVGDHEVLFCGPDEVITLKHTAYSRSIFANGAINAAVYLAKKEPGLYNMGNMIAEM